MHLKSFTSSKSTAPQHNSSLTPYAHNTQAEGTTQEGIIHPARSFHHHDSTDMDPWSTLSIKERIDKLEFDMKEIREIIEETRKGIEELKAERERQMDWMDTYMMRTDRREFKPLRADLFLAFAEKAMALLSRTHPSLVPEAIKDDRSRIPMLAELVAAIPEEVYEAWGLPGYQGLMRRSFTAVSRFQPFSHRISAETRD